MMTRVRCTVVPVAFCILDSCAFFASQQSCSPGAAVYVSLVIELSHLCPSSSLGKKHALYICISFSDYWRGLGRLFEFLVSGASEE